MSKSKWSFDEPKFGDIIRVEIKNSIYHYGIYVSDDEVIQYGLASDAFNTVSENVMVLSSTIKEFLNGKFLEKRNYTLHEKITKNKPNEVVLKAKARLGEKKYNLLTNNCEHFVNECVFNKHISEQV